MTEKNEETTKDLAMSQDDMKAMMKKLAGESTRTGNDVFVPIVEVSNDKITKVVDGEDIEVLGKKEFKITRKVDGEFVTEPYTTKINGVILKTRYLVEKKYEKNGTLPNYRSYEIDNLFNDKVELYAGGETVFEGTYKEFKAIYLGTYNFYVIPYVLVDGEVIRLKIKGASRQNYFEYQNEFRGDDSLSFHNTLFTLEKIKGDSFSYHVATMDVDETSKPDLTAVFEAQKDLVMFFNSFKKEDEVADATTEVLGEDELNAMDVNFAD